MGNYYLQPQSFEHSACWNEPNRSLGLSHLFLDGPSSVTDSRATIAVDSHLSLTCTLGVLLVCLVTVSAARKRRTWLESARWLLSGPRLLEDKYVTNTPFAIQTPERQYVVVSSEAHIKELSAAREDQLSLVATAEEVFQPAHTMNGVELNRLGLQHRILRALTLKLPTYQHTLTALAQQALQRELSKTGQLDDWQAISFWNLAQHTIAQANSSTFYGSDFAQDQSFLEAAIQYPQDVFIAAEALRCVPSVFAPLVASLVTRKHKASSELMSKLVPMIEKNIEAGNNAGGITPQNYIQYIIRLYPDNGPGMAQKMAQQTLALWFASVHQPAMTIYYALADMCDHPEYTQALYDEIMENLDGCGRVDIDKLYRLDSFLKESARMNASESISLRRKAIHEYHFRDGTCIPRGDWVCVPQRAIMRDPSIYAHAGSFDGFRFCRADQPTSPSSNHNKSKFTNLDPAFPFWGLGKQACPGRFYASFVIKIVLVEIIQNYDIRLKDASESRTFTWRSSIIPRAIPQFEIRRKQGHTS